MKTFTFVAEGTISLSISVQAKDEKAALKLAKNADVMSLCASCSNQSEGEWSTSGELDCQPVNIRLEGEPTEAEGDDVPY